MCTPDSTIGGRDGNHRTMYYRVRKDYMNRDGREQPLVIWLVVGRREYEAMEWLNRKGVVLVPHPLSMHRVTGSMNSHVSVGLGGLNGACDNNECIGSAPVRGDETRSVGEMGGGMAASMAAVWSRGVCYADRILNGAYGFEYGPSLGVVMETWRQEYGGVKDGSALVDTLSGRLIEDLGCEAAVRCPSTEGRLNSVRLRNVRPMLVPGRRGGWMWKVRGRESTQFNGIWPRSAPRSDGVAEGVWDTVETMREIGMEDSQSLVYEDVKELWRQRYEGYCGVDNDVLNGCSTPRLRGLRESTDSQRSGVGLGLTRSPAETATELLGSVGDRIDMTLTVCSERWGQSVSTGRVNRLPREVRDREGYIFDGPEWEVVEERRARIARQDARQTARARGAAVGGVDR